MPTEPADEAYTDIPDVISAEVDGFVTGYITIATYIDSEGVRRMYLATDDELADYEALGLLHWGLTQTEASSLMVAEGEAE